MYGKGVLITSMLSDFEFRFSSKVLFRFAILVVMGSISESLLSVEGGRMMCLGLNMSLFESLV